VSQCFFEVCYSWILFPSVVMTVRSSKRIFTVCTVGTVPIRFDESADVKAFLFTVWTVFQFLSVMMSCNCESVYSQSAQWVRTIRIRIRIRAMLWPLSLTWGLAQRGRPPFSFINFGQELLPSSSTYIRTYVHTYVRNVAS
jgi:hypothetical protein